MRATAAILLAFLSVFVAQSAFAREVVLEPGQSLENVEQFASFLATPGEREISYDDALRAYREGEYADHLQTSRSSSMHDWRTWIALSFTGGAEFDEGSVRRVIGLGGIFVELPRVYLACDGASPREILAERSGKDGPLRARYFTYVRTQTFDVSPGQNCLALINVSSSDNPNIGIFREGELGSNQVVAVLLKGGFTATLLIIGVILAVVSYLTDRPLGMIIGITYSITMLQNEASLFTTTFVQSSLDARAIWEALTILATFMMTYTFIFGFMKELRLTNRKKRRLFALALFAPLVVIAYFSNSTTDIIWAFYLSLFLFAVTASLRFDIARRLRLTAGAILILSAVLALFVEPYYLGRYLPDLAIEFVRDAIRLAAGAGMLFLLLVDVLQSRRARARLIEERIAAFETQSETDRILLQTERKYARALESASRRKAQLAAASHDIRQPLTGLRAAVRSEEDRLSPMLRTRLTKAFDYLESLTNEYSTKEPGEGHSSNDIDEAYSLDLITRAVGEMFGGEAKEAGVELQIKSADCRTNVPALALIRATSNLVANALRHADADKIIVEVSCDEQCCVVVQDDGKGMDPATLEEALKLGGKSSESDGEGLGLAIVRDLAQRHSFDFTFESNLGKGTRAILVLPVR